MNDAYLVLLTSAVTAGFIHTVVGIDHSLPFIVLAKARRWSLTRTLGITTLCGMAHVLSSILIASIGLALGVAGNKLSWIEQTRGSWAAWMLVGFGAAYAMLGLWKRKSSGGKDTRGAIPSEPVVPLLVLIFALGPCEPLIPLVAAGGALLSFSKVAIVAATFSATTLATMLTIVTLGHWGTRRSGFFEGQSSLSSYGHVLAGASIAVAGLTIQLFGL